MKSILIFALALFSPLANADQVTEKFIKDKAVTSAKINSGAAVNGQALFADGAGGVTFSSLPVGAGNGTTFFFDDTASDISTYFVLHSYPAGGTEEDDNTAVTTSVSPKLIEAYATPAGGIGATQIDGGVWHFSTFGNVSSTSGTTCTLLFNIYKRVAAGTETLLFSTNTASLTTAVALYEVESVQPAFAINSSDRIVVKVYATNTSTTSRTVHFYHNGTTHYSHLHTPLITRHNDLAGLQGGDATERFHLTSAQATVATQAATGSLNGYLSSTDHATFAGKLAATSSAVIGLFTSCTGTQYLGADGACHTASSGGGDLTWSEKTSNSTMVAGEGHIANSSSLLDFTLPATAAVGTKFGVIGKGSGKWRIMTNASAAAQRIRNGGSGSGVSSSSAIEVANSNLQYDSINLVCTVADSEFTVFPATNANIVSNYYGNGSDGSVTISTDTSLTSTTDGDMVVKNYVDLTVDITKTLTVSNRCKGLWLYVSGNLTVNGTISMTAKGASVDPSAAGVSASGLIIKRFATDGASSDPGTNLWTGAGSAILAAENNQPFGALNKLITIARAGATGGAAATDSGANVGTAGTAGQSGGGGSGGSYENRTSYSGAGGTGTCFSGGSGGGAICAINGDGGPGGNGSSIGGAGGAGALGGIAPAAGGGAGNNGGSGGLLVIVVKGNITVGANGIISSNGSAGGNGIGGAPYYYGAGGGGSGGGNIVMLYGGSYTNNGSIIANGGAGGTGYNTNGPAGGAGSIQTAQIAK
jgi:hypothetical protein